jgi:single-strand DNA-binding protein
MTQDNQITLRGYLTADPKIYQKTATSVPVTEIRVGSTPRRLNRETGEWQDLPTSYYRVKVWRRLAINSAGSLRKGDRVVIRGHFYMNQWVDNQQRPRSTLEIEADSLGHDLAYGWAIYQRGSRSPAGRADVDAGETARQDVGSPDPRDEADDASDADDGFSPDYTVGESADESPEVAFDRDAGGDGEPGGAADGPAGDVGLTEPGTEAQVADTEARLVDAVPF